MFPKITALKAYLIAGQGDGADYHDQKSGHWIIDHPISTPMSRYEEYKKTRTSFGINVLKSIIVKIQTESGHEGIATGLGGIPAIFLIHEHFTRFVVGADPRDMNRISEQMFRASMYYGRKGLAVSTISSIDLALWDVVGKIRGEPVYKMIGGTTLKELKLYVTGPYPWWAKELGYWGGKVPLPYGPDEENGLQKNYEFLKAHREKVGPDFPIMVDCWMSLNVQYVIELATECLSLNINWWEEVLHPDDIKGLSILRRALPQLKWTTGEHEYSKYGFRNLITSRAVDILQPDVMWVGGLTELLKITAMAAAYDIPVVPHGSGPYSYHFAVSQNNTPFSEIICNAPDGLSVRPVFGNLFLNEPVPVNGKIEVSQLDKPGFGMELNPEVKLIDGHQLIQSGL